MDTRDLIELVRDMRLAQLCHARTRSADALSAARRLELRVDNALADVLGAPAEQRALFEPERNNEAQKM